MAMGPEPPEEPFEEEPYVLRRGPSAAVRMIALVLLLAFGATYAGVNLFSALRSRDAAPPKAGEADPRGFRFLSIDPSTNQPVRYDPCTPIHYVINEANAPSGGIEDVHAAIGLTAQASGLTFAFDGIVDEPLDTDRELVQEARYGRRWAPILIGWIPFDSEIFDVDDVGVAGSAIRSNDDGRLVFVSGTIFMNGAEQLDNGFRPGKTWGKVVLHELGHVLGLDHVQDPAQVMHPNIVSSPAVWGTGDMTALRQIGPTSGCLEMPTVGD